MNQKARYIGTLWPRVRNSRFAQNASIMMGASIIVRISALLQSLIIARVLGIAEYGVYGFIFSTLGFFSSVMGFQMGSAASILISRYRQNDKEKAVSVIRYLFYFSWTVAIGTIVIILPFSNLFAVSFLHSSNYTISVVLIVFLFATNLVGDIKSGVVHGFEDFRSVSRAKVVTALLSLGSVYPAVAYWGIAGIISVLLGGSVIRLTLFHLAVIRGKRKFKFPSRGSGVIFSDILWNFSFPAMLLDSLKGSATWFGFLLLSNQPEGFKYIALVNVGLQWRGPVLLITDTISSVAIPKISKHFSNNEGASIVRFRHILLMIYGGASLLITILLIIFTPFLLTLYGKDFPEGYWVFVILIISILPTLLSNVCFQELIGHGKLWRQLWLHVPAIATMVFVFIVAIPAWGGLGYSVAIACSSFLLLVTLAVRYKDVMNIVDT